MNYILSANGAAIAGAMIFAAFFSFRAYRAQITIPGIIAGSTTLLFGLTTTVLLVLHTVTVLATPFSGFAIDPAFSYDFRFYSLILFGLVSLPPALQLVRQSSSISMNNPEAHRRVVKALLFLLAINAPLFPLQSFGRILTIAAASVLLIVLIVGKISAREGGGATRDSKPIDTSSIKET